MNVDFFQKSSQRLLKKMGSSLLILIKYWIEICRRERKYLVLLALLCLSWSEVTWAQDDRPWGWLPGYTDDVERERRIVYIQMPPLAEPPPPPPPLLKDLLFVEELNREFEEAYARRFGFSEEDRLYLERSRYNFYDSVGPNKDAFRGDFEEELAERREFGEFMLRRLTEYHVDQVFRKEPSLRPVWEAKERISNYEVEVRPGYSLTAQYSFSGNRLDIDLRNPYVETLIYLQMEGSGLGPGPVRETTISLKYPWSPSILMAAYYVIEDEQVSLVTEKSLRESWKISLTASYLLSGELVSGEGTEDEVDNRIIAGLRWGY